jgi:hypothetical protein
MMQQVEVKAFLNQSFVTKDLGDLHDFLGIEAVRGKHGMSLSQRKYTLSILADAGYYFLVPSLLRYHSSRAERET